MKKGLVIGVVILLALLAGRMYLPVWLRGYVNKQIAGLEEYGGSIDDIALDLYRGAYVIEGLALYRIDGQRRVPFFSSPKIDLSIHWSMLLHGHLVGEIVFASPVLNFVASPGKEDDSGQATDWTEPLRNLMPIRINRLELKDGEVHFRDFLSDPKVDVYLHRLNGFATNISNVVDRTKPLPSRLRLEGVSVGNGVLECSGGLNILKAVPDFDLDIRFEGADLRDFNDFLKAYSNTDAAAGTVNLYVEIAAEDGKMTGYVKPLLTDVDLARWQQDKDQPLQYAWEAFVGMLLEVFENQPRDQFGMKVPLEGQLQHPAAEMVPAVWTIVSNAFIEALQRSTDGTIDFSDAQQE